jgi:hypothetical protein
VRDKPLFVKKEIRLYFLSSQKGADKPSFEREKNSREREREKEREKERETQK